jgi:hypothetical protein
MANWDEKYNKLSEKKLEVEGNKEWRLAVEESKSKGTLQLNVRLFQKAKVEGGYEGPTKNGFINSINSKEDIENLQNIFNEFFDEAKKLFD